MLLERGGASRRFSHSGGATDEGEVEFAHLLFAQFLYDSVEQPERSRLHAAALWGPRAISGTAKAAVHAHLGHLVGDQTAIDVLETAGGRAVAVGALDGAVDYLTTASRSGRRSCWSRQRPRRRRGAPSGPTRQALALTVIVEHLPPVRDRKGEHAVDSALVPGRVPSRVYPADAADRWRLPTGADQFRPAKTCR
jgi:hypothetical protein